MANKITVLLDLVTDKAQSAVKGFRSSIQDADGATGKFKAGAASAFSSVQANAGALALGAGTALAAFGAKAVESFTTGALAAGKFAEASGLAVEDASRSQEVARDLGVESDKFAGAFIKMEKAIATGGPAVKELGIEVIRTEDGMADMNATMLDAIDRLGGIVDPTERAKAASELFGRGFADMAEIVLGDADAIKQRLDEVAGAQVFDEAEVEKARRFRDTMDDLKDTAEQFMLVVGEALVPVLSDAAEQLTAMSEGVTELKEAFDLIPGMPKGVQLWWDYMSPLGWQRNLVRGGGVVKDFGKKLFGMGDDARGTALATEVLDETLGPLIDSIVEATDKTTLLDRALEPIADAVLAAVEADERSAESRAANTTAADLYVESLGMLPAALERVQDATIEQTETDAIYRAQARLIADEMESKGVRVLEDKAAADDRAAEAAERHREQIDLVVEALDRQYDAAFRLIGGDIAVREAQRRAAESGEELNVVLADQETDITEAGAAIDRTADSYLNAAQVSAAYREEQLLANGNTVDAKVQAQLYQEELQKLVDQLDGPLAAALQKYIDDLDALDGRTVNTTVVLTRAGREGDTFGTPFGGAFHSGGVVPGPIGAERLILAQGGETVLPANTSAVAASPTVINVNFYTTELDPDKVVNAIQKYDRRNTR